MLESIRIGVIGDFTPGSPTHLATDEALDHAADSLSLQLKTEWVPTAAVAELGASKALGEFDGLWSAPGSPYRSKEGALQAIQYAREQRKPFLGT